MMIKKYAIICWFLVLLALPAFADDTLETGKVIPKVICQQDSSESYSLYLPSTYGADKSWPLLFIFEPAARTLIPLDIFKSAAETYGYIVICPSNAKNGPRQPIIKAMKALWVDVNKRFSIDKKRIYASGFSGGSRMASYLQFVIGQPVSGIIGVGAGISQAMTTPQIKDIPYYGICGYADFNYQEMVRLQRALIELNTVHRFVYYEQRHRWPPETLCTRGIEWFQLLAMKKGLISKQEKQVLIQSLFKKESLLAGERVKSGEIYFAAMDYRAISRVFDGLVSDSQLKSFVSKASQLEQSRAFKQFQRDDQKRMDLELEYLSRFLTGFNTIKKNSPKSIRLPKLLAAMGVTQLVRQLKKKKNLFEHSLADRVLYNLTNKAHREGLAHMQAGDYKRALLFWEMGTVAGEHTFFNSLIAYNKACTYARLGKSKKALKSLQEAVEKGFNRPDLIKSDSDLASLRDLPEFKLVLKQIQ